LKTYVRAFAICLMITVGVIATAVSGGVPDGSGFVRITPAELHWQDVPGGHGAQQAILLGDPNKPGLYVVRAKFPPYVMDHPHWHPNARYVTVLEGTWYTGTGDTLDLAKAVPLNPGSVMMHPAKATHWDGSAGPETVIVQITGEGPVTSTLVDPKQPFWFEAPH
jgi:hypothetical protein